jgi:hypothetical protein
MINVNAHALHCKAKQEKENTSDKNGSLPAAIYASHPSDHQHQTSKNPWNPHHTSWALSSQIQSSESQLFSYDCRECPRTK